MSRVTREINKISITVISISAKIIFYVLVAVLLVLGARQGYAFGHSIFYAPGLEAEPGTDISVTLNGSESVGEVGALLEEKGLIRDDNAFMIQAMCYGYEPQAGTFVLNTSKSSKELIDILESGEES